MALMILLPLVGGGVIAVASERLAKHIGLITSFIVFALALILAWHHPHWITGNYWPASDGSGAASNIGLDLGLGVGLTLAVDTVSLLLVLMTTFLTPLALLASFTSVRFREREFYGWFLVLLSAMLLAFMARDAIAFFIGYELTIVPMLFLIAIYGGAERRVAAVRFFVVTFVSSVFSLAGIIYVAAMRASEYGDWTFSLPLLQQFASTQFSDSQSFWVFIALMIGPCVKVTFFPVHTWLPLAHDQAPTAGSVILAATLLKLGSYMIFRVVLPMTPTGAVECIEVLATLSVIAIVAISLICLVQKDMKRLVAYSSVSHMGVAMLGMLALNPLGVTGSIMYMLSHGLSTGALFLLIGMMYERYHTKAFSELGGLAKRMPIWAFFMVFFTLASIGLPGLNGFVSEFLCLFGAFTASANSETGYPGLLGPRWMVIAGFGSTILGAVYMLYMVGRVVWGPLKEPHGHGASGEHAGAHGTTSERGADQTHDDGPKLPADLNFREIAVLVPIAVVCLAIGLQPWPLLSAVEPSARLTLAPYPAAVENYLAREAKRQNTGDGLALETPTQNPTQTPITAKP